MKLIASSNNTSRLEIANKLLDEGVIMLHFLPQKQGVVVPIQFQNLPILRLNFSYRYGLEDFEIDEKGLRASLSFRGVNQFCDIPWSAVLGISSNITDELYLWAEDFSFDELAPSLPQSVVEKLQAVMLAEDENSPTPNEEKAQKWLENLIGTDIIRGEEEKEDEDEDVPPGGYTPLRLV